MRKLIIQLFMISLHNKDREEQIKKMQSPNNGKWHGSITWVIQSWCDFRDSDSFKFMSINENQILLLNVICFKW